MDEEVKETLNNIERWMKIIGIQQTRPLLMEMLSSEDPEEEKNLRIIYHLSNGENSTRDIADRVSVGKTAVSRRQKRWAKIGLVEKEHSRAPYQHVISLEEAGIPVPDIPDPEADEEDSTDDEDSTEGGESDADGDDVQMTFKG